MTGRALFVTGTDTGVGKTHVACALARGLRARGLTVGVMKPCETGLEESEPWGLPLASDAARLVVASGCTAAEKLVLPYAFRLPAAPSVAAAAEGALVEFDVLSEALQALLADHEIVLVEGAGGISVPLAPGFTFLDFASHLRLPVLIVARTGLGTLNHTVLTERAARAAGLRVLGVVLSAVDGAPSASDRANLEPLPGLLASPVLAEMAYAEAPDSDADAELAEALLQRWGVTA